MHVRTSSTRRWIAVVLINLALFVVLLEGAAALASFAETGRLFYTAPDSPAFIDSREEPLLDASLLFRLHPYFGFVIQPGKTWTPGFDPGGPPPRANNLGFNSPLDFPVPRTSDRQFFAAILGGSAAANYATFERLRNDGGGLRGIPALADRDVVILNFAVGGYKQPQQLAVFAYFLATGQAIDLVVNIDGFNEVALSRLNESRGYAFTVPNADQIVPLVDLASGRWDSTRVEALARISALRREIAAFERARDRCRLAACDQWFRLRLRRAEAELARAPEQAARPEETGEPVLLLEPAGPEPAPFEEIAEVWARGSEAIHDLAAARGIPYLHVVQPNQYAPHGRRFTAEEKRVALDEDGLYAAAVREGYPSLLREVPRLRERGVSIVAPLDLFDDFAEPAYRDPCCHFTIEGNRLFSDFVAESVGRIASARAWSP